MFLGACLVLTPISHTHHLKLVVSFDGVYMSKLLFDSRCSRVHRTWQIFVSKQLSTMNPIQGVVFLCAYVCIYLQPMYVPLFGCAFCLMCCAVCVQTTLYGSAVRGEHLSLRYLLVICCSPFVTHHELVCLLLVQPGGVVAYMCIGCVMISVQRNTLVFDKCQFLIFHLYIFISHVIITVGP